MLMAASLVARTLQVNVIGLISKPVQASALRDLGKSDPHVFAIEQHLAQLQDQFQAPAQESAAAYPGSISADAGLT